MKSDTTTRGLLERSVRSMSTASTRPDWSQSPVARYIQLGTLFRNRIALGHWQVGQRIPTVEELSSDHGVARETIRQALGILVQEGLIERVRAKGTHVLRSPADTTAHTLEVSWSSLADAHEGAKLKVLDRSATNVPPQRIAHSGSLAPRYRTMRRLHSRGSPYLLSTLYLDESIYRQVPARRFATESTLQILQDLPNLKIGCAEQVMTIGMADIELGTLLEMPINAPVCFIHRIAIDSAGTLIYVGEGIYRGDALRLDMKLR